MSRNRNKNQAAAAVSDAGDDGDAVIHAEAGAEVAEVAGDTPVATPKVTRNTELVKVENLNLEECEAELQRIGDPDIKFKDLAQQLTDLDVAHQAVVEKYNTERNKIKLAKHEEGIARNNTRERMRLIDIRLTQLKADHAAGLI